MNAAVSRPLIWDNHGCMPLRPGDTSYMERLAAVRAAGVSVLSINVAFGDDDIEKAMRMLATFRQWLSMRSEDYCLARSVDDIRRAHAQGRLAIVFDIEGADAISGSLEMLSLYYELGVRWMLLTYNRNNRYAGGCHDTDTGLTTAGKALIEEMARVGMVVCASHAGPVSALSIIDTSPHPVIFSHSNVRAVHAHPRNISDEAILACARRGGVIGLSGIGLFLGTKEQLTKTLAEHIDHVVQRVGIDHVGLGLDHVFDIRELEEYLASRDKTFPAEGGYEQLREMLSPADIPQLAEHLSARGYDSASLAKVLGGNWTRIAEQVWK
ncbi:membrane dipeptidase [Pseudomonas daroniae]|uniref:Membrane dipeptidase n=1 Tax=Phytopseudomonas daroniae TaxID=2487519 RepID=A0A4Q9QR04_9GAMM|nr:MULTISPECIES: membrane dipeptidase [Pseudomonas]TBU83249.1 membrane dipeptidase [Pseudomonas daroniae]TBU84888.1 membrane dipeptidase [Pseudomonas sp. FRB 228]TBU93819.1 membrane dipeptidase [Pseudomonas daroniae]